MINRPVPQKRMSTEEEEDDSALFRASMKGVRRIKDDGRVSLSEAKPKPHRFRPETEENPIIDRLSDFARLPPVDAETQLNFVRSGGGIQEKYLKRLRRGQLRIDSSLDMHGMNSDEAKQQLLAYLTWANAERLRVVHLVHGKGYGSAKHPVLKNKLNLWLQQCDEVLAYCSAQPKHGGSGALYVLLKKAT